MMHAHSSTRRSLRSRSSRARVALIALALAAVPPLLACGGAAKPADSASPSDSASAETDTAPADSASTASDSASASPASSASSEPAAPPAPARGAATLQGKLLGKPFKAVGACIIGPAAGKKGQVVVEIYDAKDFDVSTSCGKLPPVAGARKLGIVLPWHDGDTLDVSKLKGANGGYVMEASGGKKFARKDAGKDFKPKGTVTIVRAGRKKGDVGRIRFAVTSGKDKLDGEIDVEVPMDLSGG